MPTCSFFFKKDAAMEKEEERAKNNTAAEIEAVSAGLCGYDDLCIARLKKHKRGGSGMQIEVCDLIPIVDGESVSHYQPRLTDVFRRELTDGWFLIRGDLVFTKFDAGEILYDARCILVDKEAETVLTINTTFVQCAMCHRRFSRNTRQIQSSNLGSYYPLEHTICQECFRKRVPPLVAGLVRDSKRQAEESFDVFSDECERASKRLCSSAGDTTTEAEEPSSLVSDQ